MATISAAGIGSGLDVNSIVSQLVALERRPLEQLGRAQSKVQTQISSFGRLQSALSKLKDASGKLASSEPWTTRTAAVGDADVFDARVTGAGASARYTVKPTQLALAQSNASTAFAAKTDAVGVGALTIEIGNWTGTSAFTPKSGTPPVAITINPADDSLEKIRDKINAAGAGVNAAVVYDGTAYRLTVTSAESGASNGFRITAADADGNHTNASGLSRLTYNPPGGTSQMSRTQDGTDGIAWFNNLQVRSPTNTFDNAIEGAAVTIKKTSTSNIGLDLTFDRAAAKKSIEEFVTAYNELTKLARDLTKVEPGNAAATGPLQGDRAAVALQSQLRGLLAESGAGGAFTRLSDVGLTANTDGTLAVNAAKLDAALARPAELAKLFDTDAATPGSAGVARKLKALADSLTGDGGSIKSRADGLQERLKRYQKDQGRLEDRIEGTEKRLRAQYGALDTRMSRLNGLSSYVAQQMAALNNSNQR
jgi:flagellar hook-associated protein 2